MRELHFAYTMCLDFSETVTQHEYTLKCFPQTDETQRIRAVTIGIEPMGRQFVSRDSFGNKTICGVADTRHKQFRVFVEGEAATGLAEGRPAPYPALGMHRYATALTAAGQSLRMYPNLRGFSGSHLETALYYMENIYRDMTYTPGVTGVDTTAEEAFARRQGVCQDYAHILIALLREKQIPARYICGMMLGEGASHAWVEVEQDGSWIGIDPTNGRRTDDSYIHISCGRDAHDCRMNRGVFVGGGTQTQRVSVVVTDNSTCMK